MAPKTQRRSICFAIVAVVCLLLGAVTTVGVAWALSRHDLSQIPRARAQFVADPADSDFVAAISNGRLAGMDSWMVLISSRPAMVDPNLEPLAAEDVVPRDIYPLLMPNLLPGHQTWPSVVFAFGWPVRALACGYDSRSEWCGLLEIPWLQSASGRLLGVPILMLARGFALDTAIYATAWCLLICCSHSASRAGRRRFRVSRRMCGSCGYDLKGSKGGPCPECGA